MCFVSGDLLLTQGSSVLSLKKGNSGHIIGHRVMGRLQKKRRIRSQCKTSSIMTVVLILRSQSRSVECVSLFRKTLYDSSTEEFIRVPLWAEMSSSMTNVQNPGQDGCVVPISIRASEFVIPSSLGTSSFVIHNGRQIQSGTVQLGCVVVGMRQSDLSLIPSDAFLSPSQFITLKKRNKKAMH